MQVFAAELADLNQCHLINGNFTTDYVWQMQTHTSGPRTDIRFDRVRLPRPMQVAYPRATDELLDHWQQEGCFLVTRSTQDEVAAFIDAQPRQWQEVLWVHNLIVDRRFRRQGHASALLKAAVQWARHEHLHKIMLEMQTKNYPAIALAQKHGFQFCGFNERYYTNGDITLYFYLSI